MNANTHSTPQDWVDEDDAPDLSGPDWQARLAKARVRRGRPKSDKPKVSTTIRLDADILEHFRAGGPGWQSRLNEALREVIGGPKK